MSHATAVLSAAPSSPLAQRFGLDRALVGPLVVGLSVLLVFHLGVALNDPRYWFTETRWDEGFYVDIARNGYLLPGGNYLKDSSLAFSPGWPLLLRAVAFLTGLNPLVVRLPLSALLFLAACQAFGWTLRAFSPDHVRNNLTILFASLWPGSMYFCTAYSEALYWPLLLLCFGCMLRRRWFAAAWFAAACWFTRTPAVIVVGSLAAAIVIDAFGQRTQRGLVRGAVTLLWTMPIAALGLFGYVAITHAGTGDWLAFLNSYVAWEPCEIVTWRSVTLRTLSDALLLFPRDPTLYIAVAWFLFGPVLICLQRRAMPAVLTLFAAFAWGFFTLKDWQLDPFHDMLRWLSVVFPLHWAVVSILWRLRPGPRLLLGTAWLLASLAGYLWFVQRFVSKLWVS